MENIPLIMIVNNINALHEYALPENYRSRHFNRGDESIWAEVEKEAGEFASVQSGIEQLQKEFGPFMGEFEKRCFFIENNEGKAIGTATAWYSSVLDDYNKDFQDMSWGRLHWVGIREDYQGKKLGKPLVSIAIKRLTQLHKKVYLTTQTTSIKAVNMYLDFGFVPYVSTETCEKGWRLMAHELNHPVLKKFLG